jgi:hypothetical protein
MSVLIKTNDGSFINAAFTGFPPDSFKIGDLEMSLDQMSGITMHFLVGGALGWYDNVTPACVNTVLTHLFAIYDKTDEGGWIKNGLS